MENLKIGSKGEAVRKVQTFLGIAADGIFGPKTAEAVKTWQSANGLTADGIVGSKTYAMMFGTSEQPLNIIYNPINIHISDRKVPVKYIAIHYTAGRSSAPGMARASRNVFLTRKASADFVVDDRDIIQINPDLEKKYCWAVGDGAGKYGITNANTISIEMCSTLANGTTPAVPNHSGWSISPAVIANTLMLTRMLMKRFNIPAERVVRHYDASLKACPGIVGWNDGQLTDAKTGKVIGKNNSQEWLAFKATL